MKKTIQLLASLSLCLGFITANAQMGGPGSGPSGPDFSGAMAKLFGENPAFSAKVEVQAKGGQVGDMVMPGTISYLEGKSRFEMNLADMKGASLPPGAVQQMEQMGMAKLCTISVPDKKLVYLIYPGMQAYAQMPIKNANANKPETDFDIALTELGKEEIDGHACVKNKAVVKDKEGKATEFTVWNAADLKKFPLKIETEQSGMNFTLQFKDVKFETPDPKQFVPPPDYTKYDSVMALMQKEMMKRMSKMQTQGMQGTDSPER